MTFVKVTLETQTELMVLELATKLVTLLCVPVGETDATVVIEPDTSVLLWTLVSEVELFQIWELV